MKQTKIESLIEATINTLIGFVVTFTFLPLVNFVCGIEMSGGQMTASTVLFTILSVARSYVVRRFFNNHLQLLKKRIKNIIEKK